jgi:ElaA protein
MKIKIKPFNSLSVNELYQILQLRSQVFVVEQNCIYQDIDAKDDFAWHVLGKDGDKIIAYLRFFKSGDYFESSSIGRVVVADRHRKKGLAKMLMQEAMTYLFEHLNEKKITLSAQTYLTQFYNNLGFCQVGEGYLEDGIPHIKMVYG